MNQDVNIKVSNTVRHSSRPDLDKNAFSTIHLRWLLTSPS